jgi:proteasome lid subunit RPN8/RPN11
MTATAYLSIDGDLFDELMRQLVDRGRGERESGAFLLTDRGRLPEKTTRQVTALAYYDDLDPGSLTGAIDFGADGYSALAELCRQRGLRVVADIHTHPGRIVAQSRIDAAHPMVALDGHIALIAPCYAVGVTDPCELGVHLRRRGGWESFYGPAAADLVVVVRLHNRPRRRPGTWRSWPVRVVARLHRIWRRT